MTHPALRHLDHRPFPPPARPWAVAMRWLDLAFFHWPVPQETLRPHLPASVEVDQRGGTAWLGVVPFRMTGVRWRWLPPLPGTAAFAELNVRTYVRCGGTPGVWFFSLDAASWLGVRGARLGWRLPYFDARMACQRQDGAVRYRSERVHRGVVPAVLRASWRATGPAAWPATGSLAHWLVERYCLFVQGRRAVLRGDVHHVPWRLADGTAELETCDMTRLLGLSLDGPPLVHVAEPLDVVAWTPAAVPTSDGPVAAGGRCVPRASRG